MTTPEPHRRTSLQRASRRDVLVLVAVVVLVLALAVGLGGRHVVTHTSVADNTTLCRMYTDYVAALTTSNFRSQASRRYASAKLAAAAARQPEEPQLDAEPVPAAAKRLTTVLESRFATASDGYAAARAIAVKCDMDFRTGSFDGSGPITR